MKYKDLSKTQLKLLDRGIIDIAGKVDSEMVEDVREAIIRLIASGSPNIRIMITSGGGNVDYGLIVYDLLRGYEGKKEAIVHGIAASMASIILQACDTRKCMRHAGIVIHHVSQGEVSLDVLRDARKMRSMRQRLEKSQARLYKILSNRTGKTVDEIRKECEKDRKMPAEEALAFGLIDEII